MIPTLIGAGVIALMILAWRIQPKHAYTPDPDDPLDDGSIAPIDREELERAEREVMGMHDPEEERPEDDWGPGTSGRR